MTFELQLLPKQEIIRCDSENGRTYAYQGCHYTSVTSFLSQTSDMSYLEEWKKRVGEDSAAAITERAVNRGNTIHESLERYVLNQHTDESPSHGVIIKAMKQRLNKNLDRVYGVELPLASHELKLAGTGDLIGRYKGKKSIIDYKGSNKPKQLKYIDNYVLQCLIYAKMVTEMYNIDIEQLVILVAVSATYNTQEFIIDRADFPKYEKKLNKRMAEWNSK